MKNFSVLFAALFLLGTTSVFAVNDATIEDKTTATSTEMTKLLQNPDFIVEYEMEANVLFTVNDENEILILSVETEDDQVVSYVKSRLNYQTLKSNLETGKQYVLPVRIKCEK